MVGISRCAGGSAPKLVRAIEPGDCAGVVKGVPSSLLAGNTEIEISFASLSTLQDVRSAQSIVLTPRTLGELERFPRKSSWVPRGCLPRRAEGGLYPPACHGAGTSGHESVDLDPARHGQFEGQRQCWVERYPLESVECLPTSLKHGILPIAYSCSISVYSDRTQPSADQACHLNSRPSDGRLTSEALTRWVRGTSWGSRRRRCTGCGRCGPSGRRSRGSRG